MSYQVLARRFRPRSFQEVVGQDAILHSLRSSLASGRVPHALLFTGSRGVGKTTLARILARCLNCEVGVTATPCGTCATCRSILAGSNGDVVEIDAASHNLVDDIRVLRDRIGFASMGARYKVYILDEVHMLTRSAFNAFLKTLEEPPSGVVFVLATTEPHKVPDTIRSRCQVHNFARVDEVDIRSRLRSICDAEAVAVPDEVLAEIAAGALGGMRDAETGLERVLSVAKEAIAEGLVFDLAAYRRMVRRIGPERVLGVIDAMANADVAPALHLAEEIIASGADEREALGEVLDLLRAMLLLHLDGADTTLVSISGELRQTLAALAQSMPQPRIEAMIQAGLLGRERIRRLDDRRLVLELTLVRMAQAGELPLLGDLVAGLRSAPAASVVAGSMAAKAGRAALAPASPARTPTMPGVDLRVQLLDLIATHRPLLHRTIEQCSFEGPDDGGVVKMRISTTQRMHADRVHSPAVQEEIAGFLTRIVGRPVRLQVAAVPTEPTSPATEPLATAPSAATGPTVASTDGAPVPKSRATRRPGPAVRKVQEKFDGEILDVEEDGTG